MVLKHFVYLIASTISRRTYIGYSIHPLKRLKQHNGELRGGAKYTKQGRPWEIIAIVSGFPNKRIALQFEWRAHHPTKDMRRQIRTSNYDCFDNKYHHHQDNRNIMKRLICLQKIMEMEKVTNKAIPNKNMNLQINLHSN